MSCTYRPEEVVTVIPDRIERETLIDAPPDVVWRVVTEPAHINRWFTDAAELELEPGGRGEFAWNGHGAVELRVVRVERPRLFAFRWVFPEGAEPDEGNSTLVEFHLSAQGERTLLRVVESGLAAVEWPDDEKARFLESHTDGWRRHIGDLARYVAQGAETPVR